MKSHGANLPDALLQSLPVRGAWIEIVLWLSNISVPKSLPVRGAWIEMGEYIQQETDVISRSPCGERGLKWAVLEEHPICGIVAPRAGSVD